MKKLLFLFVLVIATGTMKAQTVATLIASTKALDEVANNALEKADNILSDQQRAFYINLVNYTGYVMSNLKYQTDDLDRKLKDKELAILNEINAISSKLNDASSSWEKKVDDINAIIAAAPTKLPFADRSPTPTSYTIPLLTNLQKRVINIDIKGVRLNHEKNYIIFNGKKIFPSSVPSEYQISFSVPLNETDVFSHDSLNTFKVILHKERFLGADKVYEFTPKFVVAPSKIGTIKVFYKIGYQVKEESNDQTDIVHATSGSNNTKDVPKQFNIVNRAADGWRIDKKSIKCWKESGNGDKHGYAGPYQGTITDISFVAKAYAKDGHAVCRCKWNEYRIVPRDSVASASISLSYNKQEIIELPENLINHIKTEVTYYDGSVYQTTDAFFKKDYVEFKFDQLRKLVQVKFAGL